MVTTGLLCDVIAGPEPLLCERDVEEALGHSVIPIFRLIYAQIAGALAALAQSIHDDLHHSRQVLYHLPAKFCSTSACALLCRYSQMSQCLCCISE